MFYRLRESLMRFMAGRYGMDALNRTLLIVYLVLWFIHYLLPGVAGFILYWCSLGLALWVLFRCLSRDILRRQAENDRFSRWRYKMRDRTQRLTARVKDIRRYRYRRCPGCGATLRLPIKRGRRTVTCGRCHTQFKAFFL